MPPARSRPLQPQQPREVDGNRKEETWKCASQTTDSTLTCVSPGTFDTSSLLSGLWCCLCFRGCHWGCRGCCRDCWGCWMHDLLLATIYGWSSSNTTAAPYIRRCQIGMQRPHYCAKTRHFCTLNVTTFKKALDLTLERGTTFSDMDADNWLVLAFFKIELWNFQDELG